MAGFYVDKHCSETTCVNWVIRWRTAADEDGIPCLALYWGPETGSVPMVFGSEDDADIFSARMNKVFDLKGTDN